jgi:hypothetical protein
MEMQVVQAFSAVVLLLLSNHLIAQENLVPNGGFEEYTSCPDNYGQIEKAIHWSDPNNGSSDFFHNCGIGGSSPVILPPPSCDLIIQPHSGDGIAGLITVFNIHQREYIQVKLSESLDSGQQYFFSAFLHASCISNSNISGSIGVYFSDTIIALTVPHFNVIPNIQRNPYSFIQIDYDWVHWEALFESKGDEEYLIIGNFLPDSLSPTVGSDVGAYMFIDDISLTLLDTTSGVGENEIIVMQLAPNPATSSVTINYQGNKKMQGVALVDLIGRSVKSQGPARQVDVGGLNNGVYVVVVEFEGGVKAVSKLVVQRE